MGPTASASFDVTDWDAPLSRTVPRPHLTRVAVSKTRVGEGLFCGVNAPADGAGYVVSERSSGCLDGPDGTISSTSATHEVTTTAGGTSTSAPSASSPHSPRTEAERESIPIPH
jgi:hypothetical protein